MKAKTCETKTFESFVKRLKEVTHIITLTEIQATEEEKRVRKSCTCQKNESEEWKKRFLSRGGLKKICSEHYSRQWSTDVCSSAAEFPKRFGRRRKGLDKLAFWKDCEAKEAKRLSSIKKRQEVRKCKPLIPCKPPIEEGACVFCLTSIYTGGFIHELYETTPLIIKQSELYGDDIAWRIGNRTRVMVHKKCYRNYIDVLSREKDKEDFSGSIYESLEEDSDDFCGLKKAEESEEEKIEKEDRTYGYGYRDSNRVSTLSWDEFNKPPFCLKKFQPPRIPSVKSVKDREELAFLLGTQNSEVLFVILYQWYSSALLYSVLDNNVLEKKLL